MAVSATPIAAFFPAISCKFRAGLGPEDRDRVKLSIQGRRSYTATKLKLNRYVPPAASRNGLVRHIILRKLLRQECEQAAKAFKTVTHGGGL